MQALRQVKKKHKAKTHCRLGHELKGDNLLIAGNSKCRTCRNASFRRYRLRKYGMTNDALMAMLDEQKAKCLICMIAITLEMTMSKIGNPRPMATTAHIDHCHRTGRVRGLLCMKCNTALGYLKDDPVRIRRAAKYLESTQQLEIILQ